MWDMWLDLPAWLRVLLALGIMVAGGAIAWYLSFRVGLVIFALGFALFLFGGASGGEDKGYKF
jgi:hypothetical protein